MTSDGETTITIDLKVEEKSLRIYHIGQVMPFTYSDLLWSDPNIEIPGITLTFMSHLAWTCQSNLVKHSAHEATWALCTVRRDIPRVQNVTLYFDLSLDINLKCDLDLQTPRMH